MEYHGDEPKWTCPSHIGSCHIMDRQSAKLENSLELEDRELEVGQRGFEGRH